jgi:hypothetical protein
MPSKSNYEGTLRLLAPAGGVTAGTMVFVATARNRYAILPMTTATSGNFYTGMIEGYVKDAPVSTLCAATTGGVPLLWLTTVAKFKHLTAAGNAQALSVTTITAGATTADVILRFPSSIV